MDRKNFYYRQKVTEAELDEAFDDVENADRNLIVDQDFTGITSGLGVAENAPTDLQVIVSGPGVAYSKSGKRCNFPSSSEVVDLSVDDLAVSTAVVNPGNSRVISLFIDFDRVLSDERTDGNSASVFYQQDESYKFSVVQGSEAPTGTEIAPALDSEKILLADITIDYNQTQILNADIDTSRRETRQIALSGVFYGGGPAWADGTLNPSTDLESQIDKMINDLGQDPAGSDRILSAASAGAPVTLAQDSVFAQIVELQTGINDHINDAVQAHNASAIQNTPYGIISATEVQTALEEVSDAIDATYKLNNVQVYIKGVGDTGTYNPPAGTKALVVHIIGGGGGGGGVDATGTGDAGAGGGGGSGGYVRRFYSSPAAGYSYAVGAGGAGGGPNATGASGENTTFGTLTAGGGAGGTGIVSTTNSSAAPGSGGTASGGTVNVPGSPGKWGIEVAGYISSIGYGGNAPGPFGGDGGVPSSLNANGGTGFDYGAGGSGGCVERTTTDRNGGAGAPGIIVIEEYN